MGADQFTLAGDLSITDVTCSAPHSDEKFVRSNVPIPTNEGTEKIISFAILAYETIGAYWDEVMANCQSWWRAG